MTESKPLSRQLLDSEWELRKRSHPSTRTELPWTEIIPEVIRAIDNTHHGKKFVVIKKVSDHICTSTNNYKHLSGIPESAIRARIGIVLDKKLGWKRFTAVGSRAAVYVDPRVEN